MERIVLYLETRGGPHARRMRPGGRFPCGSEDVGGNSDRTTPAGGPPL